MLDTSADDQTIAQIREILSGIDGIRNVDSLKTRISGAFLFVDVEIACDENLPLKDAHAIAEHAKEVLSASSLSILDPMIHVNPYSEKKATTENSAEELPTENK